MKALSDFLISFCSISIIMGGLFMLNPKGNMEKSVRLVMGLVFLCCIITPIAGVKLSEIKVSVPSYTPEVSEQVARSSAELVFAEALKKENIEFSKITVCTDKSDDGSIIINEVIVYSSSPIDKIKALIGNSEQYEVTVINE